VEADAEREALRPSVWPGRCHWQRASAARVKHLHRLLRRAIHRPTREFCSRRKKSPTSVCRLSTCSIKRTRVFPASSSLPDMVVAAVVDTAAAAVDMVVAVMGAPRADAATAVEAAAAEDAASADVEEAAADAEAAACGSQASACAEFPLRMASCLIRRTLFISRLDCSARQNSPLGPSRLIEDAIQRMSM
jgi:hypothetical protein